MPAVFFLLLYVTFVMDIKDIKNSAEEKINQAEKFLHNDFEQTKKDVSNEEKKAYEQKGILEEKLRNATEK